MVEWEIVVVVVDVIGGGGLFVVFVECYDGVIGKGGGEKGVGLMVEVMIDEMLVVGRCIVVVFEVLV